MSILTSFTRPPAAFTTFSSVGVSCLQGPHHVAQKSTRTGTWREASTTSCMNVFWSPSMIMLAAAFAAPGAWPMIWSMVAQSWSLTFTCSRSANKQAAEPALHWPDHAVLRRRRPGSAARRSVEQRADRAFIADAAHGLGQQRRDRQFPDVRAALHLGGRQDRIGDRHHLNRRGSDAR